MYANLEGAVAERYYLGADAPVEFWIEGDDAAEPVREAVDAHGETFGSETWDASRDAVLGLCRWREALEREGIAVEALRRELVDEMVAVRERARHKQVEVEVERR